MRGCAHVEAGDTAGRPVNLLQRAGARVGAAMLLGIGCGTLGVGAPAQAGPKAAPASSTSEDYLEAVACATTTACWAVGEDGEYPSNQTLAERWNGSAWTLVGSPSPGIPNALDGAACISAKDCWGVGYYHTSGMLQTLTEQWNGSTWAVVSSPNLSAYDGLDAVTCDGATDCWAVGTSGQNIVTTLIEQWKGSAWAVVSSINPSSTENELNAVSCASASECWAVGLSYNASTKSNQTLIERWNGSSWAVVSSPDASSFSNSLDGVVCVNAGDCWAAGYYQKTSTGPDQTLIEQWNGSTWAVVSSPNVKTLGNILHGIACARAAECWAAGEAQNASTGASQTLIEKWNGKTWVVVSSPNR
jgi:hypothetical protein